jgi:23S rRNA (cytidine2498-2'-O)-methyltransferase
MEKAESIEIAGYPKTEAGSAFVEFHTYESGGAREFLLKQDFRHLIFARQWFAAGSLLENLPPTDRVGPILAEIRQWGFPFGSFVLEVADTNEARDYLHFCHKFTGAMRRALGEAQLLRDEIGLPRLHIFFLDSTRCYVGISYPGNSAPWCMGIPGLTIPKEAPSRSSLKLLEAWHRFIPADEWEHELMGSMRAVDLGAAPGGWTAMLVMRSIFVTAIDNGPLDSRLAQSPLVEHLRVDGFTYRPPKPVDWVVCDMVEQPSRIARLMAVWLAKGWSRRALFNLKLPMKKRYQELNRCRDIIAAELQSGRFNPILQIKHLYHDREEVSAYLRLGKNF